MIEDQSARMLPATVGMLIELDDLRIENAALKRALRRVLEQHDNAAIDRDEAQMRQGELTEAVLLAIHYLEMENDIEAIQILDDSL